MKQKIIKGIALLVFASFIGVFVWYNVQKNDVKAGQPGIDKTAMQSDSLQDTIPTAPADGTETGSLQPIKENNAVPTPAID